jgi:hypothetical protein
VGGAIDAFMTGGGVTVVVAREANCRGTIEEGEVGDTKKARAFRE